MAKDQDGNDLNSGDQVSMTGTVSISAPPPPDDNALIQVTLTTLAPDGSPTTVEVWSGQVKRVASAPAGGTQAGHRPQSPHAPARPNQPQGRPRT